MCQAQIAAVWVQVLHGSFALLGGTVPTPVGGVDGVALALYVFGSYLNTGSEYQRHVWKQRPENAGRLYREGFFRWAMHINYFGDLVLFSGFALLTHRVWAFIVPLLMAAGFVFVNIPMLDRYLRGKYGAEFESYEKRTKRFLPGVY